MLTFTAAVVSRLAFSPELRPWLGPRYRLLRALPALPGAVWLAGGGVLALGLASVFDSVWHTAFGLDETGWSFPHALLGWGLMLAFGGLLACRLALRPHRPLAGYTRVLLGVLAMGFLTSTLLGPLDHNRTPELLRRVAALPALANEPPFQHTVRIYLRWHIFRTSAFFLPLSAFAAGVALAFVRDLARRPWLLLLATFLFTLLTSGKGNANHVGLAADLRAWAPLPLLPAALAFCSLTALRLSERSAWSAAGLLFGLLVSAIWGAPPLLAIPAAPLMLAGALLGRQIFRVIEAPERTRVLRLLAAVAAAPALTGTLDLFLRMHTA